jgi:6-pyruvoyltetrahydropterin/6-carboxytetrahydropterin synthase
MFTISVETHFHASHQLRFPNGEKEPIHFHNWSVTADVSSAKLDNMGIVMDFEELKGIIDNIVVSFNNNKVEGIDYFQKNNPSAENVAKYIYDKLEPQLPEGVILSSIKVTEEPGCMAKFED